MRNAALQYVHYTIFFKQHAQLNALLTRRVYPLAFTFISMASRSCKHNIQLHPLQKHTSVEGEKRYLHLLSHMCHHDGWIHSGERKLGHWKPCSVDLLKGLLSEIGSLEWVTHTCQKIPDSQRNHTAGSVKHI